MVRNIINILLTLSTKTLLVSSQASTLSRGLALIFDDIFGLALLGYVQRAVPDLSPEKALLLELGVGHDEREQIYCVCLLSTDLMFIWEARAEKK
jgi:hypothetical protein